MMSPDTAAVDSKGHGHGQHQHQQPQPLHKGQHRRRSSQQQHGSSSSLTGLVARNLNLEKGGFRHVCVVAVATYVFVTVFVLQARIVFDGNNGNGGTTNGVVGDIASAGVPAVGVRRELREVRDYAAARYRSIRRPGDNKQNPEVSTSGSGVPAPDASTTKALAAIKVVDGSQSSGRTLRTLDTMDGAVASSRCPVVGGATAAEEDVRTTLAVQLSLDRAWLLNEHCARWRTDPIVAVVAVRPDEEKQRRLFDAQADALNESCPNLTLIKYLLTTEQIKPEKFPVNIVRNVALDEVETTHVLSVDVDFIPSRDLDLTIRETLKERRRYFEQNKTDDTQQQQREAVVVPAFERLLKTKCANKSKDCFDRCETEEECTQHLRRNSSFIPQTFDGLRTCVDGGQCIVFQEDIKVRGHSSTRSEEWLERQWYDGSGDNGVDGSDGGKSPRGIRKLSCFKSDQYEPYVVLRWCPGAGAAPPSPAAGKNRDEKPKPVAPYYDERFHGYGKNKISHVSHLRHMGYSYAVLPEGFLVHTPHVASKSKEAWRDKRTLLRDSMDRLYPQFLEDLAAKYAAFKDVAVPVACPKRKKASEDRIRLLKSEPEGSSVSSSVNETTAVDVSDPELYEAVDLKGDSTTATVIGMGTNYPLEVHQRFVGSLRMSGYKGNILLLVESTISPEIKEYFEARNVTYKAVEMLNSTSCADQRRGLISDISNEQCLKAYPELKARWGRYPLLRDFLQSCETCTGPVLYVDVRDTFFQMDPFGKGLKPVKGLQVYEEHQNHSTTHWFVARPMLQCKNATFDEPNLCSGSTVGTRPAMLKYLDIMFEEIKDWIKTPNCTFSDQSVHNYVYYSKKLPFASPVKNQAGGVVNTVFHSARSIVEDHVAKMLELHGDVVPAKPKEMRVAKALEFAFEGANGTRWLPEKYKLIDDEGFFIEADGSRSRAVHKYDRFGDVGSHYYKSWLSKQEWLQDSVTSSTS